MSATKEAPIDPSLVARMKKKASPAKKRRIPLSSVGTKEADKLRKESTITPPSKRKGNINVQDIVDGLRQVLDAYDGSMGGPHAKRKTSTGGGTEAQRKVAATIDDLFERYKTHDKEEDSNDHIGFTVGQDSGYDSDATITDDEEETKKQKGGRKKKKKGKPRGPSAWTTYMKEQKATPGIKKLKTHKERMKKIGEYWAVEKKIYTERYKKRLAAKKEKEDGGVDALMKSKWSS